MKKVSLFTLIICFATKIIAQPEPANYTIALNKFKQLYNNNRPDSIFNMFSPEMKAALPLDNFRSTTMQLKGQLGNLVETDFVKYEAPLAYYKATFQKNTFLLNLSVNSQNQFTGLLLKPYQPAATANAIPATSAIPTDPSITESPVSLKTMSGSIAGTLAIPKNAEGKIPVVLIIAGSGPTDRDGNIPKMGLSANVYKMIANELGKNGYASLRYDKRLVGQSVSSTKESELRFEDYIEDAVNLINMLNDDQRFSKIIILGHSEGSLVGMMAAYEQPIKAFISVAGAGDSADSVARPSVQKYLMSWFRYNPTREIKKIKIPILIVQGTTDLQVTVADAEKLKKAKSDAVLAIIPNMNHVLKEAPADKAQNTATYNQPDLPLKPEFVKAMISFLNKVK